MNNGKKNPGLRQRSPFSCLFPVLGLCLVSGLFQSCMAKAQAQAERPEQNVPQSTPVPAVASASETPRVYMTTDISPAGLAAVYAALGRTLPGLYRSLCPLNRFFC
jgi:hypothetical protein